VEETRARLAELLAGEEPILAGPFTGEVGFELLYWNPFLRWVLRSYPELDGRLVVVSRGGAGGWLADANATHIDLFSLMSPADFVALRPSLKQAAVTPFDQDVVDLARRRLGLERIGLLHPSLLFAIYLAARRNDPYAFAAAVGPGDGQGEGLAAIYARLPAPPLSPEVERLLPENFVAVRFYFRPSFPDTPENRRFAEDVIRRLSDRQPVVLLSHPFEVDEHVDLPAFEGPNIVSLAHLMTAEDNLSVQTQAISRAGAFVGTYGGLAYLPPLLGVPSIAFSSAPEHTLHWHLALAQRIFDFPSFGALASLRPRDARIVSLLS
jgi:hypothetical protein